MTEPLLQALNAVNQTLIGPEHVGWRLRANTEALGIARRLGDRLLRMGADSHAGMVFLEFGRLAEVRASLEEAKSLLRAPAEPQWAFEQAIWGGTVALVEGRLGDAERLAGEAREFGRGLQGLDPRACTGSRCSPCAGNRVASTK